ncbi:ABC transporter ATP-binding protein [Paenibacillus odorifer]|nr:ABC transporter ATP-binding protein [Paenibacillus odorifer]
MITTILSIQGLTYSFPETEQPPVFAKLSMDIRQGEFVSVVGASGCGKSTFFKTVAGLLEPTHGKIKLPTLPSTASRLGQIAYMPQQDLLLPWRTVLDNCLLPWEIKPRFSKQKTITQIREMLARFGLTDVEKAYPHELSGGMKQRVAFLRTLVAGGGSGLMLLDEPFGALDAMTKREIHRWLLELWGELNQTIMLITHDLEEALLLSDRIYLLSGGTHSELQEIIVDLPKPRHYKMNYEPRFIALRAELERRLHATYTF